MGKLRYFAASLLAALLVSVAACGGDSDDVAFQAAAPAQGGSLDVSQLVTTLEEIESFRFNMRVAIDFDAPTGATGEDAMAAAFLALLGNIEIEGAYVAPDRAAVEMSFFGMDVEMVQIGDRAWTNDGSGWVEDANVTAFTSPLDMGGMGENPLDFLPPGVLEGARTSREDVNGVQATRYSFDKDSLAAMAAAAGENIGMEDLEEIESLTLDIWLTDDGLPVKLKFLADGSSPEGDVSLDMEFNFSDFNDAGIRIDAPI